MKKIQLHYGADLDWVEPFVKKFKGKVDGNFIILPEEIHTGSRYFLDCGQGVIALYIDVKYNCDLQIIQKNLKHDFVGLYYHLSVDPTRLSFGDISTSMGSWTYNLSLIDSSLDHTFEVKKDDEIFIFCIFVKKEIIKSYAQNNNFSSKTIEAIMNPSKNTFIRWDRMCHESIHILDDLRKLQVGEVLFDLNMIGSAHMLISNYLTKISENNIIIQQVNQDDLSNIISAQQFLLKNLNNHFPGIKLIAAKFNMSESKFKILFKKITGNTANAFFLDNKLIKAKELLEENQLSVTEISKTFSFGDTAYFSSKFRKKFGILPKTYTQQL
ncbi:AraC-like DNA-binding protein [Flavobacterium sp. 9]|uniref:helix-turn-helix transcriptional regulator n=1 Tax=Flavobacterium sp. 9 TaxID=2035198 RepID=UPI000C1A888C|nr:AraC family transcriptional regulator [Flavobacterium sp. 9]PIF30186.1 AraC-like DNA-binding protein [Flavobacterium sp. 9]